MNPGSAPALACWSRRPAETNFQARATEWQPRSLLPRHRKFATAGRGRQHARRVRSPEIRRAWRQAARRSPASAKPPPASPARSLPKSNP